MVLATDKGAACVPLRFGDSTRNSGAVVQRETAASGASAKPARPANHRHRHRRRHPSVHACERDRRESGAVRELVRAEVGDGALPPMQVQGLRFCRNPHRRRFQPLRRRRRRSRARTATPRRCRVVPRAPRRAGDASVRGCASFCSRTVIVPSGASAPRAPLATTHRRCRRRRRRRRRRRPRCTPSSPRTRRWRYARAGAHQIGTNTLRHVQV